MGLLFSRLRPSSSRGAGYDPRRFCFSASGPDGNSRTFIFNCSPEDCPSCIRDAASHQVKWEPFRALPWRSKFYVTRAGDNIETVTAAIVAAGFREAPSHLLEYNTFSTSKGVVTGFPASEGHDGRIEEDGVAESLVAESLGEGGPVQAALTPGLLHSQVATVQKTMLFHCTSSGSFSGLPSHLPGFQRDGIILRSYPAQSDFHVDLEHADAARQFLLSNGWHGR